MSATKADAERNVREFLKAHGREGLLELFLTNYLFELVMYYLHSEKSKPVVQEDTGYRFYVNGRDRAYSAEEIETFRKELKVECRKKAASIVTSIKQKGLVERLEHEILLDQGVAQQIVEAFESLTLPPS